MEGGGGINADVRCLPITTTRQRHSLASRIHSIYTRAFRPAITTDEGKRGEGRAGFTSIGGWVEFSLQYHIFLLSCI